MARARLGDWAFGRTPEMVRRQERTVAHPIRSSLLLGTIWGAAMGVFISTTVVGVLLGVIAGNLTFGPLMVWETKRRLRRRQSQSS